MKSLPRLLAAVVLAFAALAAGPATAWDEDV
jgi:hypothetical protein